MDNLNGTGNTEGLEKFVVRARWVVEHEFEIGAESAEEASEIVWDAIHYGDSTDLPKGVYVQGTVSVEDTKKASEFATLGRQEA